MIESSFIIKPSTHSNTNTTYVLSSPGVHRLQIVALSSRYKYIVTDQLRCSHASQAAPSTDEIPSKRCL